MWPLLYVLPLLVIRGYLVVRSLLMLLMVLLHLRSGCRNHLPSRC
jgi:hypothetical protein